MQDRKIVHVYPPPDGSDATELLQRAIDEAGEHGTVHLHPGEYRTTSPEYGLAPSRYPRCGSNAASGSRPRARMYWPRSRTATSRSTGLRAAIGGGRIEVTSLPTGCRYRRRRMPVLKSCGCAFAGSDRECLI